MGDSGGDYHIGMLIIITDIITVNIDRIYSVRNRGSGQSECSTDSATNITILNAMGLKVLKCM